MSDESTTLMESDSIEQVICDSDGLIETLLEKNYVVEGLGDHARIWLRPDQRIPRNEANEHGYTVGHVKTCSEHSTFAAKVTFDSMMMINRAELRRHERVRENDD